MNLWHYLNTWVRLLSYSLKWGSTRLSCSSFTKLVVGRYFDNHSWVLKVLMCIFCIYVSYHLCYKSNMVAWIVYAIICFLFEKPKRFFVYPSLFIFFSKISLGHLLQPLMRPHSSTVVCFIPTWVPVLYGTSTNKLACWTYLNASLLVFWRAYGRVLQAQFLI